jgi:hypothetical protein
MILVEAKAYIEEGVDYRSRAEGDSECRIRAALSSAKEAFGATAAGGRKHASCSVLR